jgi:hypothetical protein
MYVTTFCYRHFGTEGGIACTQWQAGWRGPRTATQLKFDSSTEYNSNALSAKENCAAVAGLQWAIWNHVAECNMELDTESTIAKAGTLISWEKP